MDELRRRRSFLFDRRQSRSNGSQSFLRRFLCSSEGLAWQLHPISPEYVPLPRYRLLSPSPTENTAALRNNYRRNDDRGAELQTATSSVKKGNKWRSWLPDPHRRWPVQGW